MSASPLLTLSQIALLAEIAATPITMDIADLTNTPRGHDLQKLGQWRLVQLEKGESGRHPVRFRYSRTTMPD